VPSSTSRSLMRSGTRRRAVSAPTSMA
jgi:hypothetical protein